MVFDAQNKPVDYRFLETNPVFEKQTGLVNAVGKTARELVPNLEEHWFTLYGKVALTGEAVRFENGSGAMGRWFDVYAFRLGDQDSRKIALLFSDITKRKRAEAALVGLNHELEDRVKERTQQVQSLAAELTLAEGRERHRIAQVLHDNLQQQLYAAQFALREVRRRTGENAEALENLEKASTLIKDAIVTARRTTANLNPPVLRGEGLLEALRWLSSDIRERYGLNVSIDAATAPTVSSESVRMLLFNLVRELLFNVTKPAKVDEVTVVLVERHNQLKITVGDLGAGFDPTLLDSAEYGTGLGLSGVHKRLQLFGGRLEVDSAPGKGTRVTIALPTASLSWDE